jgi:hypothetical protein
MLNAALSVMYVRIQNNFRVRFGGKLISEAAKTAAKLISIVKLAVIGYDEVIALLGTLHRLLSAFYINYGKSAVGKYGMLADMSAARIRTAVTLNSRHPFGNGSF